VIRRAAVVPRAVRSALAALAIAAGLAGCSTFEQADAAARVGDDELTQDQLDELLVAATPGATSEEPTEVSADTARSLTQTWVVTRLLTDAVVADGGAVTDDDRAAARSQLEEQQGDAWENTEPAIQDLVVDQTAAVAVWQALSPAASEDELRAAYDAGIQESGIACTAQILVESEEDARAVLDELAAGADFADVAGERSIDTVSGSEGGVIPCEPAATFVESYVPEYVDGALAAEVGVPTEPVLSQFGYHIILVRPYDDVADEGIDEIYNDPNLRFRRLVDDADVYVDPRVGTFDPAVGIVSIG
jgi:parvulin-like peptidyl-prolyl isomerase